MAYNMKHSRRGKCLVFNHQNFDTNTGCKQRLGTDVDANAIVKCFYNFEFDIQKFDDASYKDIRDSLSKGMQIFV
jgi:hypothetical protein